jgi:hypothetical protein
MAPFSLGVVAHHGGRRAGQDQVTRDMAQRLLRAGLAALLWIKLPAESDGICGGETTYLVSPTQARRLTVNSPFVPADPSACRGRRRPANHGETLPNMIGVALQGGWRSSLAAASSTEMPWCAAVCRIRSAAVSAERPWRSISTPVARSSASRRSRSAWRSWAWCWAD